MLEFPEEILLATSSAGKAEEFQMLFTIHGVTTRVKTYADFGLVAPDETGTTFVENCRIKAAAGCTATGLVTLADDSGLCIPALDGAPGAYSADWAAGTNGNRDFARAMRRIDSELGSKDRNAYFTCTLILRASNGVEMIAEGRVNGSLLTADSPRGHNGHGYDSWFVPDGFDKSFGELPPEVKNDYSHRARAFKNLLNH